MTADSVPPAAENQEDVDRDRVGAPQDDGGDQVGVAGDLDS
jgi:hypothetical protein